MGCCRKECGASYLIKSCSTTTPIYKSSLWWGLLAVGEPILRSAGGPMWWWAARQCCLLYIAGQRVWWLQQCPPNSSPNSPNLREGRGTHPWGVKAGYLGAVSTYIASFHPLKIFYLPRSSCAQCHANLPWNIAQSSGVGCPELTQCLSGFWFTLLITEY